MSVERSFEAWEEVQRHGQDLADRLAQGFTGLIQSHVNPPSFTWPNPQMSKMASFHFPSQHFGEKNHVLSIAQPGINGVSAILDFGNRIGQAGMGLGESLNGMVKQFFRRLPVPFRHQEIAVISVGKDMSPKGQKTDLSSSRQEDLGSITERLRDLGVTETDGSADAVADEEIAGFNLRTAGVLGRPQGIINVTSNYNSRTHDLEHSLVARGNLWRLEASTVTSTSGDDSLSHFLVQLGPVLFVRDTTLLLPVHLSKQHLLWYGYDRKNGMHSLCPAVWSKHRRWLLMSMLCVKPLACSFVDLQFPNGQLTYVAGEGITTSAFLPLCGGLFQVQGQYPGEMKFSFSSKNKWGTRVTPTLQWPDKSFTLSLSQALAWQRSGLLIKPTVQFSLCPTIGGSNPGLQTEVVHSFRENLSLICGCAITARPSAHVSLCVGRSKWNDNVGRAGIVVRADTPLTGGGQPSISLQLNNSFEF